MQSDAENQDSYALIVMAAERQKRDLGRQGPWPEEYERQGVAYPSEVVR